MNIFYMKIKRFQALQKKWRDNVQSGDPTHPYLEFERNCSVSEIFPQIVIQIYSFQTNEQTKSSEEKKNTCLSLTGECLFGRKFCLFTNVKQTKQMSVKYDFYGVLQWQLMS